MQKILNNNQQCQAFAQKDKEFCFRHDPTSDEAKLIAVWAEGVPVPVGSSMGFLTRCWLDAYEASVVVKRLDEIEEKLNNNVFNK